MKRYLVFKGSDYYPNGGWEDFSGDFDTIEEAREAATTNRYEWSHIIDTTTKKEVE